ncbi:hypothetical protein HY345_02075, partial [Candidatus Microgenomates bacterium]|nr:hypothetical protein [Candidatus Microgenomates bacterium]
MIKSSKSLDLEQPDLKEEPPKKKTPFLIGVLVLVIFIVGFGVYILSNSFSTEKKYVPQTFVERQKYIPTDPIEIK